MRGILRFLILAIAIFVLGLQYSYGQYQNEKKQDNNSQKEPIKANNEICPVDFKRLYALGHNPSAKLFPYTYKGKTYDFDSAACIEEFKKDPEKYLKEWQKKERFRRINLIND